MKNLKLLTLLMLFASSFIFIQCTSDVITGPQGLAGIDGVDGQDGQNGVNGTNGVGAESCIACHSNSHREPIESSYEMSGHYNQTIMYDGSLLTDYTNQSFFNGSCSECHSNEGYINYINGKTPETIDGPTVVSCVTCHDKHGTFDFENDGNDYALRNFDPVPLRKVNSDYVIDYGDMSNVCISCHQPRTIPRLDADEAGVEDGLIEVPNRYGPHYGAQSIMLEGIYGAEIAGSSEYPAAVSSAHRNAASCVSCHMGDPNENDGQHSMIATLTSCVSCHGDGTETLITNLQTEVDGYMAELEVLFTTHGLLDSEGDLVYDVEYPAAVADAYWNYKMVYYDHSKGVHNPTYTRALLQNSIEAVEALPAP